MRPLELTTTGSISLEERCAEIKSRVNELRRPGLWQWFRRLSLEHQRTVFGAGTHRFRLNPPVTESELDSFERRNGVDLPADYRAFFARVGNGGAGPYYGIHSLEQQHDLFSRDERARWMSAECPLNERLPAAWPDWLISAGGVDWEDRWERDEWHPYQGTLVLCDVGCAYYFVLLLSGRDKGRVCGISPDLEPPLFPPQRTFLRWYEAWLDAVYWGRAELFEDGTSFLR